MFTVSYKLVYNKPKRLHRVCTPHNTFSSLWMAPFTFGVLHPSFVKMMTATITEQYLIIHSMKGKKWLA